MKIWQKISKKKIKLSFDLAILVWGIYLKKQTNEQQRDLKKLHQRQIAPLVLIAAYWKQLVCKYKINEY